MRLAGLGLLPSISPPPSSPPGPLDDGGAEEPSGLLVILMGAPRRLLDDPIDHPEPQEIGRGHLHSGRCLVGLRAILPEDRCTTLWGDDAVGPVLEDRSEEHTS